MNINLIFIDNNLNDLFVFIDSINDNSFYIIYKFTDTYDILLNFIKNSNITLFDHIAFIFENDYTSNKNFVNNNTFISQETINFINTITKLYNVKTIDFLACSLLLEDIWKTYFNNLPILVRASNDKTGNLLLGGDWILESTNEDIRNLYFTDKILDWNNLLDGQSYHSIILLEDQSIRTFGRNTSGRLGDNTSTDRWEPITTVPSITNAMGVSSGYKHSAVLLTDNTVKTFGSNTYG